MTLMTTITELKLADSLIPLMSSKVTPTAISNPGRLIRPETSLPSASVTLSQGPLAAEERVEQIKNSTLIAGQFCRINPWKHDVGAQAEDYQKPHGVQDQDPQIFDRKNILYGGKEPFHD